MFLSINFVETPPSVSIPRDNGVTWEEISPDLTRDQDELQGKGGGPYTNEAVGAENYGTLAYLIESPHEAGVLITGSDDGLLHITKNGGESWEDASNYQIEGDFGDVQPGTEKNILLWIRHQYCLFV